METSGPENPPEGQTSAPHNNFRGRGSFRSRGGGFRGRGGPGFSA